jgi:hypothetical protein
VLCKEALHRLVMTMPAVDAAINTVSDAALFDYEVMLMSLPAILDTQTDADIPNQPYLFVAPDDQLRWTDKMATYLGPKVGLVWSGELKLGLWQAMRMNLRRSIPLDLLRPLFDADCTFFSLQKGERQKDLKDFYVPHPMIDLMNDCTDFYDTACLISNLDLIIAVDTSVAHLAGALGKPVWMLSRLDGDWRWMVERSDSPWYPTMTIYRQDTFADWRPVLRRLTADLVQFAHPNAQFM